MPFPFDPMPPTWLVQCAVAAVWLYEGLWCKVLARSRHEFEVVSEVRFLRPWMLATFLRALGVVECALAAWVLSGWQPAWAALARTVLLVGLNTGGLTLARARIPDPAGMVLKNLALLVLARVCAALPLQGGRVSDAPTPWLRVRFDAGGGPQLLLFGHMHEDDAIERAAFAAGSRVFCIASAGDTALALCADHEVTAVDINPVQVDDARARFGGAPPRTGAAERLMGFGRGLLPLLGWRHLRVEEFLSMDDPSAQARWFAEHLDTWRFRAAVAAALSLTAACKVYGSELPAIVPPRIGAVLRGRLASCIARHPNRGNPWLRLLLTGDAGIAPPPPARAASIELHCADAPAFLADGPPARFDAFTLSNIFDGANAAFAERLRCAVRHAARPGALVVRRSFREPGSGDAPRFDRGALDRSVLWGVVDVRLVGDWV
jgi:hypothetical protein